MARVSGSTISKRDEGRQPIKCVSVPHCILPKSNNGTCANSKRNNCRAMANEIVQGAGGSKAHTSIVVRNGGAKQRQHSDSGDVCHSMRHANTRLQ